MRNIFKPLLAMVGVASIATSCNKVETDYPKWMAYVTINELEDGYDFLRDDKSTMYPGDVSRFPAYDAEGKDGDRVFIHFNYIEEPYLEYDYNVEVHQIVDILSKDVEKAKTDEDLEEFGDDQIEITGTSISGGWLDLAFQLGVSTGSKHKVSLVDNSADVPPTDKPDGYHYLELRHQADSVTSAVYPQVGYASYRLSDEYNPAVTGAKGLYIRMLSFDDEVEYVKVEYSNIAEKSTVNVSANKALIK